MPRWYHGVIWVDLRKDFKEPQLKETVIQRIQRQCGLDQLVMGMTANHEQFALFLDHTDDVDEAQLEAAVESVLSRSTRIKVRTHPLAVE